MGNVWLVGEAGLTADVELVVAGSVIIKGLVGDAVGPDTTERLVSDTVEPVLVNELVVEIAGSVMLNGLVNTAVGSVKPIGVLVKPPGSMPMKGLVGAVGLVGEKGIVEEMGIVDVGLIGHWGGSLQVQVHVQFREAMLVVEVHVVTEEVIEVKGIVLAAALAKDKRIITERRLPFLSFALELEAALNISSVPRRTAQNAHTVRHNLPMNLTRESDIL